jgi:hypothetical protein
MRLSTITFLSLPLTLFITASAQNSGTPTTLEPDTPIERTIGSTETHSFSVNLTDNQYLQFVVNQHGIDLIVRVFSPTGKSLGEFDSPNGAEGPENVSIVAVTAGSYRISVSALDENNSVKDAKYEIKILEIRDATEQELKVANAEEERKAKGRALLSDLIDSIPEIRLPQTRIRVKLQSAALLRTFDEKKSSQLITEGLTEARDYLATLKQDDQAYEEAVQWLRQLRYEAVQTLAAHDPEAALSLFRSTRRPIEELNRDDQQQERQFELSLATQIAGKNPRRAFEMAQESLKTGYSTTLATTLRRLRQTDQDLANSLTKDIISKLLADKFLQNFEAMDTALTLIRASSKFSEQNALPLLAAQDYRALVQKIVNEGLTATPTPNEVQKGNTPQRLLMNLKQIVGNELDSLVPGATQAIQKKLAESSFKDPNDDWKRFEDAVDNSTPETLKETIAQAPPELRDHLLQRVAERNIFKGNFAQAKQIINDSQMNPRARRDVLNRMERQAAQNEANQGHMEEALKHVAKIESAQDRAQLIGELANRIGSGQKKEQTLFLLETARSLLGTAIQGENLAHMNALINLAAAFSRYDSKRGFEMLDPLVDQFNDLSNAAKTLNGFGPEYFVNGELSMKNGNSLSTLAYPVANALGSLSLTDFDRAKSTADRFVLPEVRMNLYLAIVQQALLPNGVYSPTAVYWNNLNR